MNDESEKLVQNIVQTGNYCLNLCYPLQDLNEYKKCYRTCLSFLDKKQEFVENYLNQLDYIIKGETAPRVNYDTTPLDNNRMVDKYVFKDYYYQSSSNHDVGAPDPKPSVKSLFGKNK